MDPIRRLVVDQLEDDGTGKLALLDDSADAAQLEDGIADSCLSNRLGGFMCVFGPNGGHHGGDQHACRSE